jgi:glycosyltransferase involved in cell wall biosynthesis
MRILFVTYDHPFTGRSGVSMYSRDLIPALLARGATVGVICIHHRDWRFRPYVRTSEEQGTTLYALVNSPLDPGDSLYRPAQDASHPIIEKLFRSCIHHFRPDLLHVQTLQGFPGSIVPLAKRLGVPTVVMLHDCWALCPRVGLMRPQGESCEGPDGGRNCVRFCVSSPAVRQRVFRLGTRLPSGRLRDAFFSARALYRRLTRKEMSQWTPTPGNPGRPDAGLLAAHALRGPSLLGDLADADQLLAVSDFIKSVFVRHGVPETRIQTLTTTLALGEYVTWTPRQARDSRIRFGFLGRAVLDKGAHVFAVAARDVPLDRAQFLVFGPTTAESEQHLAKLSGDRLEFRGPYARRDLGQVLDQVDVVIVPSVVQESVGLVACEANAAGVPVIASRIGAIPEFIRDGENGLLFAPGDSSDLRRQMLRIIDTPALVATLSAQTRPPAPMSEHVDRLLEIYRACRARPAQEQPA